jgi:hypothetical protein
MHSAIPLASNTTAISRASAQPATRADLTPLTFPSSGSKAPLDSAPPSPPQSSGPATAAGGASGSGGFGGIFAALLPLALAGIIAARAERRREPFFRARPRALAVAASPD